MFSTCLQLWRKVGAIVNVWKIQQSVRAYKLSAPSDSLSGGCINASHSTLSMQFDLSILCTSEVCFLDKTRLRPPRSLHHVKDAAMIDLRVQQLDNNEFEAYVVTYELRYGWCYH